MTTIDGCVLCDVSQSVFVNNGQIIQLDLRRVDTCIAKSCRSMVVISCNSDGPKERLEQTPSSNHNGCDHVVTLYYVSRKVCFTYLLV